MITYLTVIAKLHSFGKVEPLSVVWEDGRLFPIDKILDVRPCASLKGGGAGVRYTVVMQGKEKYLFFDKDRFWIENLS